LYLWQIGYDTPGLWSVDDFEWLLEKAVNSSLPLSHRTQYANVAASLPWNEKSENLTHWLSSHNQIPRDSRLYEPLSVDLEGDEAKAARKMLAEMKRLSRPHPVKKVHPPPQKRVLGVLDLCEEKDPRNFFGLSQELTLKEDSTHYEFERFLSRAPGWAAADEGTKGRILRAARNFLAADTDEPERIRTQPFNSILSGYMQAIWLLLEFDRVWIDGLPGDWWRRWMLYLLRQISMNLSDELQEPKHQLLRLMHQKAPSEFRKVILEFATSTGTDSQNLLSSLLNAMDALPDRELDRELGESLARRVVSSDRIGIVAEFILGRDVERALPVCMSLLDRDAVAANEETAIRAAVALLFESTSEAWESVSAFLHDRRDLAPRILAEFAHNERLRYRQGIVPDGVVELTTTQKGQLISMLLEFFPYETNPHYDGAHLVPPDDPARTLRDQLISALGNQKDAGAVSALRQLAREFGSKYSWLHDMQIRAERDYRLSQWSPVPPASVAAILEARDKRLIRSEVDAMDGVLDAIIAYGRRLQSTGHHELESLWNTDPPPPSPKAEEHVSDVICDEIKKYFERYAVTAGREMQIFRRKVGKTAGGEPGSKGDVIVQIPATGTKMDEPIVIPVEFKLSRNKEAKTGLRQQLVNRYMRQLATNVGVFAVAWMNSPRLTAKDKPIWEDIAVARKTLEKQAQKVGADSEGALSVKTIVLDATLHGDVRPEPKVRKRKGTKRTKAVPKQRKNATNKADVKTIVRQKKTGRASSRRNRRNRKK
jgi:hypothetical protein